MYVGLFNRPLVPFQYVDYRFREDTAPYTLGAASSPEASVTIHQIHKVISHSTCIFICMTIRISNFAP